MSVLTGSQNSYSCGNNFRGIWFLWHYSQIPNKLLLTDTDKAGVWTRKTYPSVKYVPKTLQGQAQGNWLFKLCKGKVESEEHFVCRCSAYEHIIERKKDILWMSPPFKNLWTSLAHRILAKACSSIKNIGNQSLCNHTKCNGNCTSMTSSIDFHLHRQCTEESL